jgi:hypothetical protein
MIDLPASEVIARDYEILRHYGEEAATICPSDILRKRYLRHVPHKTEQHHLGWGRDHWIDFDSLPRSYRDMINDDPGHPDENLKVAWEMWRQEIELAERAMDRILRYESALQGIDTLPDWLKSADSKVLSVIRQMRDFRIAHDAKLKADRAAVAAERAAQQKRDQERQQRWSRQHDRVLYTGNHGVSLREITMFDTKGMAPHMVRAMMEAKIIEPLSFQVHRYSSLGHMASFTNADLKSKIDNRPPDKVHPQHFKRGKN